MKGRVEKVLEVSLPVSRVWELVGFTTELDRAIGKPKGSYAPADETQPVALRRLTARQFGLPLVWDEAPWEFERNRFLSTTVTFLSPGPLRAMKIGVDLSPLQSGTRVCFSLDYEPARGAPGLFARALIGLMFRTGIRGVRRLLERARTVPTADAWTLQLPAHGDPVVRERARSALAGVRVQDDIDSRLLQQLADAIASINDTDVQRMRPYALARRWNADPQRVLTLLLRAARTGALELEWAVLCPDCQRSPKAPGLLSDLRGMTHCETCVVSFGVDFAHNVEVVFRPAPAVRTVDTHAFCLDNPSRMRNSAAMQVIPPGERRTYRVCLEPGMWRLRARRAKGVVPLVAVEGGPSSVCIELNGAEARHEPVRIGTGDVTIEVRLTDAHPRLVAVERAAWLDDVATAAVVTSLQEFRDLFPSEALSAGEQIAVRNLAFLFTDLKDSTALYERVGDGPAYDTVSEHFRLLIPCVAEEGGGVVKTIGDAVMAVFPTGEQAVRAAMEMLSKIEERNRQRPADSPIVLKVGVHEGPCVAVTANGSLDYFGSTVNIAARVQGLSVGGDLVLTEELAARPPVAAAVAGSRAIPFQERLKGLSNVFRLVRVTYSRDAVAAAQTGSMPATA